MVMGGCYTMQGIWRLSKHFHIAENAPLRTLQKIPDKICDHSKGKYFYNVCFSMFYFVFDEKTICY